MALVLRELYRNYVYYVHECKDPRVDNYIFMGNPLSIVALLFAYYYFVKKLGPNLMQNRKPFGLKTLMIIYNALQVVLNMVLGCLAVRMVIDHKFDFRCILVNYSGSKEAHYEALLTYCYFSVKCLDLLDTVFFVLRKSYNQISFLHVYHHILLVAATYTITRYVPGGHGSLVGLINCFVHVAMYFYYLLSCIWPEVKKSLGWKKRLTQMQMLQFSVLTVYYIRPLIFGDCAYPKFWLLIGLTQNIFMLVLFSDFYIKAYLRKAKKSV